MCFFFCFVAVAIAVRCRYCEMMIMKISREQQNYPTEHLYTKHAHNMADALHKAGT